jgi:hypothetical protein
MDQRSLEMRKVLHRSLVATLFALAVTARAASAAGVTLPDTSQNTDVTASVSEQCQITVPNSITFNVTDITSPTAASAASVSISNIVLATATKQLKLSLEANAASFTPSVSGATTWSAGDLTWNAASWTNATGAAGTLSNSSYTEVATADADVASASTTGLTFTLAAKSSIKRSGNHTLAMTWKVESIGS